MPDYLATTPGIYPLPDWAKTSLADHKGHQKHDLISGDESEEIDAIYDDARREVIDTQETAGLDLIVEGQLRWDDMLAHPLCVHDHVETRGLLRYYDNNNFYREPVVTGELTPNGDIAQELTEAKGLTEPLQTVIPGPYSLCDLATDEYYGDEASFLTAISEFLAAELSQAPSTDAVFILEPSLVTTPPDDDFQPSVRRALDAVSSATDSDVIVHTYWGALTETTYAQLLDASIDGIGIDLVADKNGNVTNLREYGAPPSIALGVVDGQNTRIETLETIRERVAWVETNLPSPTDIETIYVTTNTELVYLPVPKFEEKLSVLGQATRSEVTA